MKALVLAAFAAAGFVQQADADQEPQRYHIDIQIPAIDIEIPDIDIQIPTIDLRLSDYFNDFEFEFDSDGLVYDFDFDFDFEGLDVNVPDIVIDLPEVYVPAVRGYRGWNFKKGRDFQRHDVEHDWSAVFEFDTDTTFNVDPGTRLEIRNHAGEVVIKTWDRNAVRLEAQHSNRDRVKVYESGSAVRIKSESRSGPPDIVDYQLTVPAAMAVDVWGVYTDVDVDGSRGGIRAETLEGDIRIRNGGGEMSLRSVEGFIEVRNSSGRIEINSVDEEVALDNVAGTIFVESIDGDIRLEAIDSDDVDAKTVDGDIFFDGAIKDNGRYRLTTHDGDVVVAVPAGANATISVATFDGEFETSFPVRINQAEASRRFSFEIGDGSARIELHAFDGDIQLVRQ